MTAFPTKTAAAAMLFGLLAATGTVAADPAIPDLRATEEKDDRFTPEQRKVLDLLRTNRQLYGDDAALLQGLLLMMAVHGDAILPSECEIEGFEKNGAATDVVFRLHSGIVFDDRTLDGPARVERMWHSVLGRALLRYETFDVPADAVVVRVESHHRPYQSFSELYATPDDPGVPEWVEFRFPLEAIRALLAGETSEQEFLDASKISIEGAPVPLVLREPIVQLPAVPEGWKPD